MTAPLVVRLHDNVTVGPVLARAGRVLRLSSAAMAMLEDREVMADSAATVVLAHRLMDLDLASVVRGGSASADQSDLTVVVPVRDRPRGVDRLLRALAGEVACVVVDDASRDAEALRGVAVAHGAQLVRLEENVGPAGARNAGLTEVTTPFVAFVDSDIDVSGGQLVRLLAEFVDPALAACAPRVRTRGGRRWFERYEDSSGSLDLGPSTATVRPWSPVAYVPSACLVARVGDLGTGFDESLLSGEDVDLVWRLVASGRRVRYCADVEVWHDHRTTVAGWVGRKFLYGTSAAPLARVHGSRVAPAMFSADSAVLVVAVLIQRQWAWAAAGVLGFRFFRQISSRLPELDRRGRVQLTGSAAATTARQVSSLALRHWWPLTAIAMIFSRRVRRVALVAAVADAVKHPGFGIARRVDDLAYGSGVWWGALRSRSMRCLLPAWSGRAARGPRGWS